MAQVWYVGILGRKIGVPAFGGDIGFELAGGFTAMYVLLPYARSRFQQADPLGRNRSVYPLFRYLELKYVGR